MRPLHHHHRPLDYVCGRGLAITGSILDDDGQPLDLTGAAICWKLNKRGLAINFLTFAIGNGVTVVDPTHIRVEVSADQTAALSPGVYQDWLRVTLCDGREFSRWGGDIRLKDKNA